ncbi:UV excision repair protein [Yarrowia sp. B02]|nr:UV excision repair protein [Yarrowia sp. B02]
MLVKLRDTKRQQWTVDVEPTDTVETLKTKNAAGKDYGVAEQKMIYSGKILANDTTIESLNLKEDAFIICMVSKPKVKAATAATGTPVTPAPKTSTTSEDAPGAPVSSAQEPATEDTPSASASVAPAESTPSQPTAVTTAINNMVDMGYPRDQVEAAMRAAFNNPERAVEYLLTGVPDHVTEDDDVPETTTDTDLFAEAVAQGQGPTAAPNTSALDFLRDNPQFVEMRRMVQQQPHLLEPLIQQLAASNPQLAALITQNSEAFLHLLGEGLEEGGVPEGATEIQVTPEESDAIERLAALGFERNLVIQAYFACDKNEEVTANYLLEHGYDDDE